MNVKPLFLIHSKVESEKHLLQILSNRLSCGFPSPADDYSEQISSIDQLLIKHPAATFLARGQGDSMIERGILDGSLLVVDRAVERKHNQTIVASIHGELTVKILDLKNRQLKPANRKLKPIPLPEDLDVVCEGVVTYCITSQHGFAFTC